ncbi:nucleoside-diphosphate-sugar epimerase [Desulfosalsimonas propionicica]|uniref:Nucleoside-diphosphate-sugar epimerase n=1 Tax=Desulfosalsimonas propionicica TaxID=332175 RepID=A0A7W0C6B7_9BACT|nr:NAD-dependent epimerase/dehydratase family protein [Desulfosalsimonas propionicica]MBA2880020.1 nucleoside-diphosphate-sugar epimerase [Desulfosalsimonas propionicica]
MQNVKLFITGATGFIGRRLCEVIPEKGFAVRPALRRALDTDGIVVGDLGPATDWSAGLNGVDAVVHLAARVHVMVDKAGDPLAEFRRVNVAGTLNLARQAAGAGVKRLVFLSSVKVNGEATEFGRPFTVQDAPAPQDPYAISKFEAEQGLRQVEKETGLEVVIIRPPLVYGPGVKANFLRLMQAVQKGLPLPLGLVRNRRSMVALDNLVDLIGVCLEHPAAGGQTFLVSDGEDLSTPELIRRLAQAMGKKARLLPVPPALLRLGGSVIGKRAEVERLIGSLQVDIGHTCEKLGWRPVISVDEAIRRCVGESVSQLRRCGDAGIMEIDFGKIQDIVRNDQHRLTLHAVERLIERNIQPTEIKEAILNGEIIESYPDDKYGPSCLVSGISHRRKALHVQCSVDPVWIITAYDPALSPGRWDKNFKKRKSE